MEFSQLFTPELVNTAVLALVVLLSYAIVRLTSAVSGSERARKFLTQYQWLLEAAGDIAIRMAFNVTYDELEQYGEEASETGRDERLVAAYHELDQLARANGIVLPVEQLIGMVERKVQELKEQGVI